MTTAGADPELSPELSIVIPCFNEEENVRQICRAVTAELVGHVHSYEIILVDNKSTDNSREIIRALCAEDPRIRAIFNNRNYGQMRSPTYGLYQAKGAAIIGMCADFQDPPALIAQFVRLWRGGAMVVLGQRRSEDAPLLLRSARHFGYAFLRRFGDYPVIPGATGFGLFDRKVVDTLSTWNEPEPFWRGLVVESGFPLALVPFDRPPRAAGNSKNDSAALLSFAISALAGSAKSLLRIPILLALCSATLTLPLWVGTLVALVGGKTFWPLLILSAAFSMFAVLLLFLGLIGEQVRMLAERSRNVPLVIEAERINFPADDRPSRTAARR